MKSRKGSMLVLLVLVLGFGSGCFSDKTGSGDNLREGERLFAENDYRAAEAAYQKAVEADSASTRGWMGLAKSRLKLGNVKGAVEAYQRVLEIDTGHIDARLHLARFNVLEKDLDTAKEKVREILQTDPDNTEALFLLADIFVKEEQPEKAQALYRQILDQNPRSWGAYIRLAHIQARRGELQEAAVFLKKAVSIDPANVKTRLMLFNLYMAESDYDAAEGALAQAVAANPDKALLSIVQGKFYFARRQLDKAEESFLAAVRKAPEEVIPCLMAGKFYSSIGETAKAVAMYQNALDLQPQNAVVRYTLAEFYLKKGDTGKAARHIAAILEQRPGYFPAQLLEVKRFLVENNYERAFQQCQRLLREHPESGSLYYLRGLAFWGKEKLDSAEKAFLSAIEHTPGNIAARLMLARLYLKQKKMDKAQEVNRQIFSFLHKHFDVDLILGKTSLQNEQRQHGLESFDALSEFAAVNPFDLFREGHMDGLKQQYDNLIDSFESILASNPKLIGLFENIIILHAVKKEYDIALAKCDLQLERVGASSELAAMIYNIKGGLFLAQGKTEEARQAYQQSIAVDPDFIKPYFGLARLYLMEKNIDRAISQYRTVLEKNPRQAGPHILLGALFKLKEDYNKAEHHYRQALAINPDSFAAANNLAYLLTEYTDRPDEALSLALQAKSLNPDDPFVQDTVGWIYYKKGLYRDAVRELKESVAGLPDNATAHFHLGMAYYQINRLDLARKHLEQALALNNDFDQSAQARAILKTLAAKLTEG